MSNKKNEPGCATYAGLGVLVLCAFLVLLTPVFWVACEIRNLIVDNPGDDGFGLTDREYEALRNSDDTSMTKRVQQSVNNRFAAWKKAHSRVWGARAGLASAAVLFAVFPVLFTDYLMAPLQSPSDMMEAWVQMSLASVPTLIAAGIGYFAGSYFASDFADNHAPDSVHQLAGKYEQRRDARSAGSSPQAAVPPAGKPGPSQDDEELENVELTIAQSTCMLAGYVLRADGELTTSEEQSARLLTEIVIPQEMDTESKIQDMMRLIQEGDWSEGAAKTACNILSTADETRHLAIAQMTEIVGQTEPMTPPKKRALREVLSWLDAPQDRIRTAGDPSKRDDSGDVTSSNPTGDPDKEDVANVVLNSLALACGHILWANREFYPQDRQLVKLILDGVAPKVFDNPDDAPDINDLLDTLETGTPKTDYVKQGCGILASMEEYRDVFMELMTKVAVQSPGDMTPKKKALQEVLTWLDATPGEIHQIFSMIDEA